MADKLTKNPHRPYCPNCGRELVFAALVFDDVVLNVWLCDCSDNPADIKRDVVLAREWDEVSMV